MRDEFSKATKIKLAQRVRLTCSYPSCGRITVGADLKNTEGVINLGVAAHIHAASAGGVRYDPNMTTKERKSIENAIWLCETHAKLIDADHTKYSADTIKQWKVIAEKTAHKKVTELSKDFDDIPTTFINLNNKIIFEGRWISVENNTWNFEVGNFLLGNIENLKSLSIKKDNQIFENYIIIESQGDGRLLNGNFSWRFVDNRYEIYVSVQDKQIRINPNNVGADIALREDGDLDIGADLKIISGIENAKQIISSTLSTKFGDIFYDLAFGSYFSNYYWKFKNDVDLLNRLLKLEIARLISIPLYEPDNSISTAPLNFINRIIDVKILNNNIQNNRLSIKLKLEWGNHEIWEDKINVYIHSSEK